MHARLLNYLLAAVYLLIPVTGHQSACSSVSQAGGLELEYDGPPLQQESQRSTGIVYDVKDFGAKGNGADDDAQSIQRAVDAAAKVRGEVLVPEGSSPYLVSGIALPSNVTMTIKGTLRANSGRKPVLLLSRSSNVTLQGPGRIDGNYARDAKDIPAIELENCNGVTITGLHILGGNNAGIVARGSTSINVEGIQADSNGACGVVFYGTRYSAVHSSTFLTNNLRRLDDQPEGIGVQEGSDFCRIADNHVYVTGSLKNNSGITVQRSGWSTVTGNTVLKDSALGMGISIAQASHCVVSGNVVRNFRYGIECADVSGASFVANVVDGSQFGFGLNGDNQGSIISANVLTGNKTHGILLSGVHTGSKRFQVIGNRIERSGGSAIVFSSAGSGQSSQIMGNEIVNCDGHGIVIDGGKGIAISGNIIDSVKGSGILTLHAAQENVISGNILHGCSETPLSLVNRNTVYGNQTDARREDLEVACGMRIGGTTRLDQDLAGTTSLRGTAHFKGGSLRLAIYIPGAEMTDFYQVSWTGTVAASAAEGAPTWYAVKDSLVVQRPSGNTPNLGISYIRMR